MNQTEIWKNIKGYEGYYQVSSFGRVRSMERVVDRKIPTCSKHRQKILNPDTSIMYPRVILHKIRVKTPLLVHRLVATAFIPNPENKKEVNHLNGIKDDNRVENLEWVTPSENVQHAYDMGFKKAPVGEKAHNAKLKRHDVENIKFLLSHGCSNSVLAKQYKVCKATISHISSGRTWSHLI